MAKKKVAYDEASVIRAIERKNDVKVDYSTQTVQVIKCTTNLGNGTWGKIDYLCNYCGYSYAFVDSFDKKANSKRNVNVVDDKDVVSPKVVKRQSKLNMAAMAKTAMKKVARK